uniref:Uncharacterized protein n=1 Tax=Zea mays TaxID=4577 RepID=B6U7I9_MAIZE|nr:hypothetical protein [Zea mays]
MATVSLLSPAPSPYKIRRAPLFFSLPELPLSHALLTLLLTTSSSESVKPRQSSCSPSVFPAGVCTSLSNDDRARSPARRRRPRTPSKPRRYLPVEPLPLVDVHHSLRKSENSRLKTTSTR